MTALATTPAEIARALPEGDPARLRAASIAVDERPIAYALGSGESDEVALHAGIKPLIRQVIPPEQVSSTRARFEALGLCVAEAEHRLSQASTAGRVLFVGRDPARVRAAVGCELAPDHDLALGQLLGYPRCCVEAYLEIPPPRRNAAVHRRTSAATRGTFAARLNTLDLAVFHYVSWLPCSFSCSLSLSFADAVARHIAERHGQILGGRRSRALPSCPAGCRHQRFVAAIDEALSAHRLMLHEEVQVSIRGRFDGERVFVERAWPTARDRHPDSTSVSGPARDAVVKITAIVSAAQWVSLQDGWVFIDGRRVLRVIDGLLLPFG